MSFRRGGLIDAIVTGPATRLHGTTVQPLASFPAGGLLLSGLRLFAGFRPGAQIAPALAHLLGRESAMRIVFHGRERLERFAHRGHLALHEVVALAGLLHGLAQLRLVEHIGHQGIDAVMDRQRLVGLPQQRDPSGDYA